MENAAKALLIAGGVLITIIVVSVGIYLMRDMGEQTSKFYEIMEHAEITKFNEQFLKYEGLDLNMQDVISIMNLARDNNEKNQLVSGDERYIKVAFANSSPINFGNIFTSHNYESEAKDKLKEYTLNGYGEVNNGDFATEPGKLKIYFTCEIETSKETLLVKKITITQHDNS